MSIKGKLYLVTINQIPCRHKSFLNYFKRIYLKMVLENMGDNVNVRPQIKFVNGSNISLGNNSGIGEKSFIQDIGKVTIGNDVLMGPEVMIFTSNHNTLRTDLIRNQKLNIKDVVIEDDVWIGARVIILPGVKVAKGTVIGAGSIVTKDTEEYTIIGGNPARKIKSRI